MDLEWAMAGIEGWPYDDDLLLLFTFFFFFFGYILSLLCAVLLQGVREGKARKEEIEAFVEFQYIAFPSLSQLKEYDVKISLYG